MNTLVIGGAGFIGQWVTRRLLDNGRDVVVMGRRQVPPEGLDARARYVCGDYGDEVRLRDLLATADEIVDLAYSTVPKSSFDDPVFDIKTNLPQAVGLLQRAVEQGRIRKLVLVSSGGTVYGHATDCPVTENHATHPVSPYGITKLAIEKYGLMYHRLFALPTVIVRPGNAYGEGQMPFRGQGFIATAAASIIEGRPLTVYGGDVVVRDYIHVDDIASGICAALDSGRAGETYNVGTGTGHTTEQVLSMIGALAPQRWQSAGVERKSARPFDVLVNVLDSSKLQRETSWRIQIPLEDGLGRAWHWLNRLGLHHDGN